MDFHKKTQCIKKRLQYYNVSKKVGSTNTWFSGFDWCGFRNLQMTNLTWSPLYTWSLATLMEWRNAPQHIYFDWPRNIDSPPPPKNLHQASGAWNLYKVWKLYKTNKTHKNEIMKNNLTQKSTHRTKLSNVLIHIYLGEMYFHKKTQCIKNVYHIIASARR